jgi:hypothetical protein
MFGTLFGVGMLAGLMSVEWKLVAWKWQLVAWKWQLVAWKWQLVAWKWQLVAWKWQLVAWKWQLVAWKWQLVVCCCGQVKKVSPICRLRNLCMSPRFGPALADTKVRRSEIA